MKDWRDVRDQLTTLKQETTMPKTAEKIAFLDRVSHESPEYAELLLLFRAIYSFVDGNEGETGISFESQGDHNAARVSGGFPLLNRESMLVDDRQAERFLAEVIGVLLRVGREGGDGLASLLQAIAGGSLDLPLLFGACLNRERKALEDAAAAVGVPSPLLEFVLETALRTALGSFAETLDPAAFAGWQEGYCPVCGSRAGMAELAGDEGRRLLCCSACSFSWPFPRIKCPYCGNTEPSSLSYFEAGEGPTRVDVCRKCSRYLKTRDSRKGHGDVPLEAEDLATIHLDLTAAREGFERGK
jgi:FdhE protein